MPFAPDVSVFHGAFSCKWHKWKMVVISKYAQVDTRPEQSKGSRAILSLPSVPGPTLTHAGKFRAGLLAVFLGHFPESKLPFSTFSSN